MFGWSKADETRSGHLMKAGPNLDELALLHPNHNDDVGEQGLPDPVQSHRGDTHRLWV